jgi:hypothetical protein
VTVAGSTDSVAPVEFGVAAVDQEVPEPDIDALALDSAASATGELDHAEPDATDTGDPHRYVPGLDDETVAFPALSAIEDDPLGGGIAARDFDRVRSGRRGSVPDAVTEPSVSWWRPQLGRRLRAVAGVDERLMARVPQERARYAALGGVVVATALIAAASMWFAIAEALGHGYPLAIIPVVIWGLFIFNFDRWLISSTLGNRWYRRLGTVLMRLVMAFLFGVIIAEPLVMRVFQTAIEQNIRDARSQQLADIRSKLESCNPADALPGAAPPAGCQGYLLSFTQTPGAAVAELAAKRQDAATLQATVTSDTAILNDLNNQARLECVGSSGPGLSGRAGVGPNCSRLRAEADAFAAAHPIATESTQLTALQAEITQLEATVSGQQDQFEQVRTTLIDARVADARSHQGSIGILERLGALHRLAGTSAALFLGTWAVRLLFILVDCMPILVKYMGGVTTYDRLVARELADAELQHRVDLAKAEDERQARLRQRRAELDVELREHRAVLDSRVSRAVHDLAVEYAGQATRHAGSPGDRRAVGAARVPPD